jgi:hypothetical protein
LTKLAEDKDEVSNLNGKDALKVVLTFIILWLRTMVVVDCGVKKEGRKEGAEELRNFLCTFLVEHVTRLILISDRSSLGLVAIYLEDGGGSQNECGFETVCTGCG